MKDLRHIPRVTALFFLRCYKLCVSPFLPPACRFYPTCSDYAADAFRLHPFWKASWLALRRLVRCGPWTSSGYDPVPMPDSFPPDSLEEGRNPKREHTRYDRDHSPTFETDHSIQKG